MTFVPTRYATLELVNVPLAGSVETATLEVDSTGRMWVAYDVSSTVEVRYSDGLYTNWSAPITSSGVSRSRLKGSPALVAEYVIASGKP